MLGEALNVSVLWQLPVIFVCENNGFSEFSPSASLTAGNIVDRARPYGAAHEAVDGNDLAAVWQCAARAIERARSGEGPTLVEARTYRQRGHVEAEDSFLGAKYRSEQEVAEWIARDPIPALADKLVAGGLATPAELEAIEQRVGAEVAQAGIGVELIDPRTVVPLDSVAILASVGKTGRLVVVDEARDMCSAAAHIAALCADQAFAALRAPIRRVTVPDVALPYSPPLEKALLPNEASITRAVCDVLGKPMSAEG